LKALEVTNSNEIKKKFGKHIENDEIGLKKVRVFIIYQKTKSNMREISQYMTVKIIGNNN
jgi:hypothetical protein